ncbi:MAG TPA: hypothetical protein VJO14_03130 [Bacteroidota bacterium]|nr:hypothetical protein [Bacteroidota bacterium]
MRTHFIIFLFSAAIAAGCKTNLVEVDTTPPFAPRGIYTETGDGRVQISWFANSEPDLAAYRVYISDSYDGLYGFIGQTTAETFSDDGAANGVTVYYAVTALDRSGNESELKSTAGRGDLHAGAGFSERFR